jgi:23S rRNA pseudouridine1911/1915/1917 synthase
VDKPLNILYIDNHLIALNKPAGLLVQGDSSGDITLLEQAKQYIKSTYQKPGDVFLGLVHRLDKPVSGVVVFARTSKGAARLSDQIRRHQFIKSYLAIVEGKVPDKGHFRDYLIKEDRRSVIVSDKEGKFSELSFKRLNYHAGISKVKIELITGRYHQIRAQFSSRGFPIVGDKKYGAQKGGGHNGIGLHAWSVTFRHPVREELLTINSQMNYSIE